MKKDSPKKPSDADQYNKFVIKEVEKGHDPDNFFDWYMNKYHGHIIDSIKKICGEIVKYC